MKILFVCAGNLDRSPTSEEYFRGKYPEHEFLSAGTDVWSPDGRQLTEKELAWADQVYVMQERHKDWINKKYPDYTGKIHILDISDKYNAALEEDREKIKQILDNKINLENK